MCSNCTRASERMKREELHSPRCLANYMITSQRSRHGYPTDARSLAKERLYRQSLLQTFACTWTPPWVQGRSGVMPSAALEPAAIARQDPVPAGALLQKGTRCKRPSSCPGTSLSKAQPPARGVPRIPAKSSASSRLGIPRRSGRVSPHGSSR